MAPFVFAVAKVRNNIVFAKFLGVFFDKNMNNLYDV